MKYDKCPAPNPFLKVEKFAHTVVGHYMPPFEDFLKVVEVADRQDQIMLWTYYYTGGRRQEVLNLKWEDVDFDRMRVRLYTRKRKGGIKEANWIGLADSLAEMLMEQKQSAVSEYVFVNLRKGRTHLQPFLTGRDKFPKALCEKAGVKTFGLHGIRALTATTLARGDVPMVEIKNHLRHKNLHVTEAYVRGDVFNRSHLQVLEGGRSKTSAVA